MNNKSSDENKYCNVLESLKKNKAVKEYAIGQIVERTERLRRVKRILDVMDEQREIRAHLDTKDVGAIKEKELAFQPLREFLNELIVKWRILPGKNFQNLRDKAFLGVSHLTLQKLFSSVQWVELH